MYVVKVFCKHCLTYIGYYKSEKEGICSEVVCKNCFPENEIVTLSKKFEEMRKDE